MAIDALVAPLLKVSLFHGLRPLQISEIARRAERLVFRPGQQIVTAGAEGDCAYVIVSGTAVRTLSPEAGTLAEIIQPGSLLGEMAMLVETEYSSTIVAETPVRALKLTRASMYQQMATDPALAEHLVAKISSRLKSLAAELRAIDDRLAAEDDQADFNRVQPTTDVAARSLAFEKVRPGLDTRH
jgi:CRP-like cAMP-binding protein